MAMMTWMRRISPYLLAAVLLAFLVSLAYFGTQRGSGGAGGGGAAVVTVDGDVVSAVTFDRAYRAAGGETREIGGGRWAGGLPPMLRPPGAGGGRPVGGRLIPPGGA